MIHILYEAKQISTELASWLKSLAEKTFSFHGNNPMQHSAFNHEHLWMIEYYADQSSKIDLSFRLKAVRYILDHWKVRLTSYHPYQSSGYRLYVYEDIAPTITVVAETKEENPFPGYVYVHSLEEILALYTKRSWKENFTVDLSLIPDKKLLTVIKKHQGSLGKRPAQQLGISQAALRRWIEWWQLEEEVNQIRKQFGRLPARFRREEEIHYQRKFYEEVLPPFYATKNPRAD